jgi:hypothetical protein
MKYLSIFIDESGDFGKFDKNCPFYLITMLFHNQNENIALEMMRLDGSLTMKGYEKHCLHTGPLIRKKEVYKLLSIDERKRILNSFMAFAAKIDISYATFIIEKRDGENQFKLISKLSAQIKVFLEERIDYFSGFDKIIIYYDNGQKQLTGILAALFTDRNIEFRQNVSRSFYRLFQIADMLTTFELINKKREEGNNSKTEKDFFGSINKFNKDYYKRLVKKRLN